ncbi:transposase [Candidatus Peregrinibacteria bacterium]|nr:transposase [Candidatus Peregrinibacteria bacterium]
MTQRHPIQNGQILMITTVTLNREPVFADPACALEAVECLYRVQDLHPFLLYGFVIMPDHCHFLLNVPPPETVAVVMGTFKSGMTFNIGRKKLWQRRYYATIVHRPFLALRYIHNNPVRAGLAVSPEMYPWSSAYGKWDVSPITDW